MGRHKKQIDDTTLLKMRGEGKNLKEISEEMKTSTRTLSRRIAYLQYQEGLLTKYPQLQKMRLYVFNGIAEIHCFSGQQLT